MQLVSFVLTIVVEIMILEHCNKCIQHKQNWFLAMDIVLASRNHLHKSSIPEDEILFEIVDETIPKETKMYPELGNYDNSIYNMQNTIRKNTITFSRLLWHYDLHQLDSLREIGYDKITTIPWQKISFTKLKQELIHLFSLQTRPIPLSYRNQHLRHTAMRKPCRLGINIIKNEVISPITPLVHSRNILIESPVNKNL